jgi:hypothetical protein
MIFGKRNRPRPRIAEVPLERHDAGPTAVNTAGDERAFAPHCDARILHHPGECWACDLYPDRQELRRMWGIAFTGHKPTADQLPCPADHARPPGTPSDHRLWGPNQAAPRE